MDKYTVLVCGSRHWCYNDAIIIYNTLKDLLTNHSDLYIIHGGCAGADSYADSLSRLLHIPVKEYSADWAMHGKAAGPIRNQQMLDNETVNLVVAFHDDIENSKGTKDMINRATKAGIAVQIISD